MCLQGSGLDLRGPIQSFFAYPTLIIFCEGQGIATAKALIEATSNSGGLLFNMRSEVRMYYRVRSHAVSLPPAPEAALSSRAARLSSRIIRQDGKPIPNR